MILGVFIEFFGVKIAIGLLKNDCDLILTVKFDWLKPDRWIIIYALEIDMNR